MRRGDAPAAPRVAHLDRRDANAVEVGEELYMFLDPAAAELVPARCPHRGGPLHFATIAQDARGTVLVCPWHGTPIPLRALRRRAAAVVQSGTRVRAVIDVPEGAGVLVRHVPVRFETDGACAGGCADGAGKETPLP